MGVFGGFQPHHLQPQQRMREQAERMRQEQQRMREQAERMRQQDQMRDQAERMRQERMRQGGGWWWERQKEQKERTRQAAAAASPKDRATAAFPKIFGARPRSETSITPQPVGRKKTARNILLVILIILAFLMLSR